MLNRSIKEECLEANLQLPKLNLVDLTFGNVSVADMDRGTFAIKPSGVGYSDLKLADIVVLDLDHGKPIEGTLRPSSDTPTHRRLLAAFRGTGIRSIVHTHSRNAVAFAQAGRPIPCFGTTHADHFHGEVPVTRPMTPAEITSAYEWETGGVILERLDGMDPAHTQAVLVQSHGPFVWGTSGKNAVENAVALEVVAEMALKSMQLNPSLAPIPEVLLDTHFLRKHGPTAYYGQPQ